MKTTQTSLFDLMTANPVTIDEDATLDQAIQMLDSYSFRHLPVASCNRVVGILSDRDLRLATSLLPSDRRTRDTEGNKVPGPERVSQVMHAPVHCLSPQDTPDRAAKDMVYYQIGAIPVVENGCLVGIVTETDILEAFLELHRRAHGACDDLARYHMHQPLTSVSPQLSVEDALDRMDRRVGHLGVEEDGKLVGIVSERDLFGGLASSMIRDARAQAEGRMEDASTTVASVMTRDVLTVGPGSTLSHCAKHMTGFRVSALPIFEDGQPLGIVTQRDILEYFASIV